LGFGGLLLIPLIATILEKWLKETFFSDPNAVTTTVFINLVALSPQRWFQFALVFLTGIVVGISLDWLARKSDENKVSELRRLGSKLRSLSDIIKSRTAEVHSEWPDHVRDLKPDIVSAFISAKKIGLWVPGERAFQLSDASFLCEYLRLIGRLLEDGHFDEAKREALAWKPYLNKAKDDWYVSNTAVWQATRLQKNVALLDRQRTSRAHDNLKLAVGQTSDGLCRSLTPTGSTLSLWKLCPWPLVRAPQRAKHAKGTRFIESG
jgi:hypothetical protein